MKKKLLIITLLTLLLFTGCFGKKEKEVIVEAEPMKITSEDMDTMEKVSGLAFIIDKDTLEVGDYTEEEKAEIARNTAEKGFLSSTGTEMREAFQKYFGKNQTVTFNNIDCFMKHQTPEEQVLFVFDEAQDKYDYSEKHPGHGGGGNAHYEAKLGFDSVEAKEDRVIYNVRIMFYGQVLCHDIGPCEYGKVYKTYDDAKNDTNALVDIANSKYTTGDPETELPITDLDSLFKDYKNEFNTYSFVFIKEDDHLVFSNYKKA